MVPSNVASGSRGRSVRSMQDRLKALGYVIGQYGVNDGRTQRAILAFRKVAGMARTSSADRAVFRALITRPGPLRREVPAGTAATSRPTSGTRCSRCRPGGKVERDLPMSSGTPATPTILGSFRVYRKDPGTNAKGMVHSCYFIRGYAIHGYRAVPTYNASHGCLRVPIPNACAHLQLDRDGRRPSTPTGDTPRTDSSRSCGRTRS